MSAVEAGYVEGKCLHGQQNTKIPRLRLLPSLEVFRAHAPYRRRILKAFRPGCEVQTQREELTYPQSRSSFVVEPRLASKAQLSVQKY